MTRSGWFRLGPCSASALFGLAAVLLTLPALGGGGCSSNDNASKPSPDIRAARQVPEAYAQQVDRLVQGNTAFALDLFAELRGQAGNLFFSPYSMSTAMGMIWAGARGQTEAEIAQVFHLPYGQDALHQTFGELQRSLDTGIGYDLYRLDIANRLWGQTGYPWNAPFLETTRVDHGAELVEADIQQDQEAARQAVNAWVSETTAGKIPEVLQPGMITPLTRLVLANAIYFKGTWLTRFDASRTRTEPFRLCRRRRGGHRGGGRDGGRGRCCSWGGWRIRGGRRVAARQFQDRTPSKQ